MPITIKTGSLKFKDPDTGKYVGIDVAAETKASQQLASIEAAGEAQVASITQNGEAQMADITENGESQMADITQNGQSQVAAIQTAGQTQVSNIETKGAETLDSIPDDYTDLYNDVGVLKSAVSDVKTWEPMLVKSEDVYSGNMIDMSGVTIKANLWIDNLPSFALPDGKYFKNPFLTTQPMSMVFTPYDADGNAISMTQGGSSKSIIDPPNSYLFVLNVSGTTVQMIAYTNFHNYEIDFRTQDKTYTLASAPAYWKLDGKASSQSAELEIGLTKGAYDDEYVEYAAPTKNWLYNGKLTELPYIDVNASESMTDATKLYRMNGDIYYNNGASWVKVNIAGADVSAIDKNVFFLGMKYKESDGTVQNASNRSRTLQYIQMDAKMVMVDGTKVTGIELLAWDGNGTYKGVWNAGTLSFGTTENFTASIRLDEALAANPTYKFKINATIDGSSIDARETSDYLTWTYTADTVLKKKTDGISGASAFSDTITVKDNTTLNGSSGRTSYDANFVTTDFIDVSRAIGKKIRFNSTIVANPTGFAVYDKGRRYINGLWGNKSDLASYGYVSDNTPQRIEWELPDGAYYLRAVMHKDYYSQPSDFGVEFYEYAQKAPQRTDANFITIAHKGYGDSAYENTLYSFMNAAEAGFKAVEIDCRKMLDGVYIASHNATATLYSNGTGQSVTYESTNWSDIKGMTIDAAGEYPVCTLAQIFNTLKRYKLDYYIIDLKSGSNEEIMELARRCGVVSQIMLSYYTKQTLMDDLTMIAGYPQIAVRITPLLTPSELATVKEAIRNEIFADVNLSDGGTTYFPKALSLGLPILCSGVQESKEDAMAAIAAGGMSQTTLQYSPADFIGMLDLDLNQFPTLSTETESVSISTGTNGSVTVASDIDDPACYVYGYSDDISVCNVSQDTYGAEVTFTITMVAAGSANLIVFTPTGEQLVIPVTAS